MVSTLLQAAQTGWIALYSGPQAALSHALYTFSSWTGIQTVETVKWLGSSVGHKVAQIPDWVVDSINGKASTATPQGLDPSIAPETANTYYTTIINATGSVTDLADKAYQYVLTKIAPNAEKVGFGLSEVVGPAAFCGITGGLAITHAIKAAEKLKELVIKKGTGFEKSGDIHFSDYRTYKRWTIAGDAIMHTFVTAVLGYATYLVATPLNARLIEAGVNQDYESTAVALAIICPLVISYAYSYFNSIKGSVKDHVRSLNNQFSLVLPNDNKFERQVFKIKKAKKLSDTLSSAGSSVSGSAQPSSYGVKSPTFNSLQSTLGGLYPTLPDASAASAA